jgi:hypothetical protein
LSLRDANSGSEENESFFAFPNLGGEENCLRFATCIYTQRLHQNGNEMRDNCRRCSRKYYQKEMMLDQYSLVSLRDERGNPIRADLKARIVKGMGHEDSEQLWINYRRNHIQIEVDVSFDPFSQSLYIASVHDHCTRAIEKIDGKLNHISYKYSSETCLFPHQVERIFVHCNSVSQFRQKSKKSENTPHVGMVQSSSKRDSIKVFEPVELFDFTKKNENQCFRFLDRLQFSRATLGNDVSNDEFRVEEFILELELYAQTTTGEIILLGYAQSQPCVSRGRAPCHFEKRCPLHRKSFRHTVQKKTSSTPSPCISLTLKSTETTHSKFCYPLERPASPPISPFMASNSFCLSQMSPFQDEFQTQFVSTSDIFSLLSPKSAYET